MDRKKQEILFGRCELQLRQVASLTKIMTSLVVLNLVDEMGGSCMLARTDASVQILPNAANLVGTTARLQADDKLTVEELLYAMMLPSGNDAATSLAIYFGCLLRFDGEQPPNSYF